METEERISVYSSGEGFYEEKRSRFFSFLVSVSSEEEAAAYSARLKKEHVGCSHVCYAYRLKGSPPPEKYTDAGEPSGTAGMPILNVLRGSGAVDAGIFVIRFFGGTKLGTGGLSRAYQAAALDAVKNAVLVTKKPAGIFHLDTDYSSQGKLTYLLKEEGLMILGTEFTDKVTTSFLLPDDREEAVLNKIRDLFSARFTPVRVQDVLYADADGETVLFDEA